MSRGWIVEKIASILLLFTVSLPEMLVYHVYSVSAGLIKKIDYFSK